jgi:hypothetical protein
MRSATGALLVSSMVFCAFCWMSEENIFSKYGDHAFRPESTILCIVSTEGDTVLFRDNGKFQSPEEFSRYQLIDFLPEQNYWVVETGGYEWIEWCLVNGENGAMQTTIASPVPSPDGSRFLCAQEDIVAGFIYNGIQVWRLEAGSLVLEFEDVDVPWGPVDAMWQDDSTIVFKKHSYDWDTMDETFRPGTLSLTAGGSWIPDNPKDWMFQID